MAGRPQEEQQVQLEVGVTQIIADFFGKVPLDHLKLLNTDWEREHTKVLVAEMNLNIISHISKAFVWEFRNQMCVSEDEIYLLRTIPEIFGDFVEVSKHYNKRERLTNLIMNEVTENIKSEESGIDRVVPSTRLCAIVEEACKMLKTCQVRSKLFKSVSWRDRIYKTNQTTEMFEASHDHETKQSHIVEDLMSRHLSRLSYPLLDDVSDAEFHVFVSESTPELQLLGKSIAQLLLLQSDKRLYQSLDSGGDKKESFERILLDHLSPCFAKHVTKTMIYHTFTQLKATLRVQESEEEAAETLRSLIRSINRLCKSEIHDKTHGILRFFKLKDAFSGKIPKFTKALTDLLYSHIRKSSNPDRAVYMEVHSRVLGCLGLMGWWLSSQVSEFSSKVCVYLLKLRVPINTQQQKDESRQQTADLKQEQVYVETVIELLVTRIYRKAKVTYSTGNPQAVIRRLFSKTWPLVRSNMHMSNDTLHYINKKVHRKLCQKFGSASTVLFLMNSGDPEFEDYIVSSLGHHLSQQPFSICRFLSSVCRACCSLLKTERDGDLIS